MRFRLGRGFLYMNKVFNYHHPLTPSCKEGGCFGFRYDLLLTLRNLTLYKLMLPLPIWHQKGQRGGLKHKHFFFGINFVATEGLC